MSCNFQHAIDGPEFAKEDDRKYELPGGEVIDLDHKLRLSCGEILFKYPPPPP